MKQYNISKIWSKSIVFVLVFLGSSISIWAQTATEIVEKADNMFRGETNKSQMTMKIVRPSWERTITMKNWSKGDDFSMAYIMSPARDKGQVFLKRGNDLWNWIPSISRLIKMPPSMMSQGWMGSDVSNDDVMRQSSLVTDYTHKILGKEEIQSSVCHKIELTAKEDADVVWGKIIMWIDVENYLQLKVEYYDEEGYLVHTIKGLDIKEMGGRLVTSKMEFIPAEEPDHKTLIIIDQIEFNVEIDDSFFSQQNMKRVR